MKNVYLDNAATTMPLSIVFPNLPLDNEKMWANPSSSHIFGFEVKSKINELKFDLAQRISPSLNAENIIFTSGGTESNNIAILGSLYYFAALKGGFDKIHAITTCIEHSSVLEPFKVLQKLGVSVTFLKVNRYGEISLEELESSINEKTVLISIQQVNSEIGTVQNIEKISAVIKNKNNKIVFHSDAVQGFTKSKCNYKDIDLISISSHKIHGFKGTGALISTKYKFSEKQNLKLTPVVFGGSQEYGIRPGTENVPGILAFKNAFDFYIAAIKENKDIQSHYESLKSALLSQINSKIICNSIASKEIDSSVESPKFQTNIISLTLPIPKGEASIASRMLEDKGFLVSTRSACSSKSVEPSHVLTAIGISPKSALNTIRVSTSRFTTIDDINEFAKALNEVVIKLS